MDASTGGLILIHDAPPFLLRQIEWSVCHTLGYDVRLHWNPQTLATGFFRTEVIWQGSSDSGASLASVLAGWKSVSFEVTQNSCPGVSASRWLYVPTLGMKHRSIDEVGNYQIGEQELRSALERAGSNSLDLQREMQNLLASPWEEALEPLRLAAADSSVVWLFRAG